MRLNGAPQISILFGLAVIIIFGAAFSWRFSVLLIDAEQNARLQLKTHANTLSTVLDKHRALAVISAGRLDVAIATAGVPGNKKSVELVRRLASLSGVLGLALVTPDLRFIAADRLSPNMFDTPDFRLANAITAAKQGRLGRAYGRYTLDQDQVYVFLAPIFGNNRIEGFVCSLVGLEDVENNWGLADYKLAAVTQEGEVFLSNVSAWRGKRAKNVISDVNIVTRLLGKIFSNFEMSVDLHLPIVDWKIILQRSVQPERINALIFAAFISAVTATIGLAAIIIFSRRRRLLERYREGEHLAQKMERLVQARTQSLEVSNRQLKEAQDNLVRAGKLALLGQMSASISHELNQPLGAIKTYARNTELMLARGQIEEASKNLLNIDKVVERVTRIIVNLRSFAIQEEVENRVVEVVALVDEARAEFLERVPEASSCLKVRHANISLPTMAGEVRLLQVLLNLLNNAWASCKDMENSELSIETSCIEKAVQIRIIDNGLGIPPEFEDDIFDAFVSTRSHEYGMGLGLTISRSFIQSMGGEIELVKASAGGAEFVILLDSAES